MPANYDLRNKQTAELRQHSALNERIGRNMHISQCGSPPGHNCSTDPWSSRDARRQMPAGRTHQDLHWWADWLGGGCSCLNNIPRLIKARGAAVRDIGLRLLVDGTEKSGRLYRCRMTCNPRKHHVCVLIAQQDGHDAWRMVIQAWQSQPALGEHGTQLVRHVAAQTEALLTITAPVCLPYALWLLHGEYPEQRLHATQLQGTSAPHPSSVLLCVQAMHRPGLLIADT